LVFPIADQADLNHAVEPGTGTDLSKENPKWSSRLLGGRYDVDGLSAA
jgi:hypothetical protein